MMRWLARLHRRLQLLARKNSVEAELAEEIQLHLDLEAEDLVRQGWSRSAARREARRRLGGVEATKEQVRDARGGRVLDDLVRDLGNATRTLRRSPGFASVAIVLLALGIGANTALFGAVNGLWLQAIDASEPERLARLLWSGPNEMLRNHDGYGYVNPTETGERRSVTFSYPMFEYLRANNDTMTGMFASAPAATLNVIVDEDAEIASGVMVSGEYFRVLGVSALIGRTLEPSDDRMDAPTVAVISHAYWTRRFGRAPDIVGRPTTVNGVPVTIVGVLRPEHAGVQRTQDAPPDLFLPLSHASTLGDRRPLDEGTWWWVQIMGRLKPGVSAAQARGQLEGPFRAAAQTSIDTYLEGLSAEERTLPRNDLGGAMPRLSIESGRRGFYDPDPDATRQATLLAVVVGVALLIVCANLANLLLSRTSVRRREIAVRLSLGATRGRIVRQLLTESLLLSVVGGVLGLLLASIVRAWLPFGGAAPFDWRVFGFASALSLWTAVAFTLIPALRATRDDVSTPLGHGDRGVARGRAVPAQVSLAIQVALSLILLVGAGLFLRTLGNLRDVQLGFNADDILLFRVDPSLNGYDTVRQRTVYDELTERIGALPGVRSVALSDYALLSGGAWTRTAFLDTDAADAGHDTHTMTVSAGFFETMDIPLLAGRTFDRRRGPVEPDRVIVNAAAAREFFGTTNPIGKQFGFSPESRHAAEVIGVVGDVRYESVRDAAPPTVYQSHDRSPTGGRWVEVRTLGDPRSLIPAVRDTVRQVDPRLPMVRITTQADEIDRRLSQERLFATAYSSFGGIALLLTAVGLFGAVAYDVAQRTNEIGIRMALGAKAGQVKRMVLKESAAVVTIGIVMGLVGVWISGSLVSSLLYDLEPTDGAALLQAVGTMLVVGAIAAYLPARRAAKVDPLIALRCE